jgi:hypothetical protein
VENDEYFADFSGGLDKQRLLWQDSVVINPQNSAGILLQFLIQPQDRRPACTVYSNVP